MRLCDKNSAFVTADSVFAGKIRWEILMIRVSGIGCGGIRHISGVTAHGGGRIGDLIRHHCRRRTRASRRAARLISAGTGAGSQEKQENGESE